MHILDIFFPKRCVGCGKLGAYICLRCVSSMRPIRTYETICPMCEKPAIDGQTHPNCQTKYAIDGLISFFHYDGVVKKAIKEMKYRLVSDMAKEFVSSMPLLELKNQLRNNGCIETSHKQIVQRLHETSYNLYTQGSALPIFTPIPLHQDRKKLRGFNQTEILGKLIAHQIEILYEPSVLQRVKKTVPQVEMSSKEERLKNMHGVFAVKPDMDLRGSSLLLFDDVFTTGATMRDATSIVKKHGVVSVWAVTIAR